MIETSITAWIWMLAAMLASSGAGLALMRFVPWSDAAREAGIPRAFACAIAPFLLGMLSVLALGLFRGASHAFHLGVVFTGLLLLCSTVVVSHPLPKLERSETPLTVGRWEWVFGGLLAVWVLALLVNTALLPLIQNDSLEYATVGRLLFESRDLLTYPAIDPAAGSSGFYGPWTHPPLYVALIYLMYIFQGHAEMPGLMLCVSPWFALAGTALVFTFGNLTSRITGILSALVFISVPLFFLGADSALIDPLPVLGVTILFAAVIGMQGTSVQNGLVQGLALGASLWTHSVAILFIPLALIAVALCRGWKDWPALSHQIGAMLCIAVPLAAWPYFRNIVLYGSPISDNPAVFAMPELAWAEYFRISRGIDSWPEKIQYGILKGWFSFEAYSISFWLMSWGAGLYVRRLISQANWPNVRRGDVNSVPERWLLAGLGMVLCYLGGTLLSTLLGIDLMIRNERYWLVLIPFVALFAAGGIVETGSLAGKYLNKKEAVRKSIFAQAFISVIALCFFLQAIATIVLYCWAPYMKYGANLEIDAGDLQLLEKFMQDRGIPSRIRRVSRDEIIVVDQSSAAGRTQEHTAATYNGNEDLDKLFMWPQIQAMKYLRDRIPSSATVLTLRPADMYYSGRRMMSYLDPRLLPLYREKDALEAWRYLRELGIEYLHVPEYYLPILYNSILNELIARPDLATLLFSADGNQIFALCQTDSTVEAESHYITPGRVPWTKVTSMTGGRKALGSIGGFKPRVVMDNRGPSDIGVPLFQRDWSTTWISGIGTWSKSPLKESNVPVRGATEYRLEMDLEGHALVRVWLLQMNSGGNVLKGEFPLSARQVRIGEFVLGPTHPERRFIRRFVTHPEAAYIRVGVEHVGSSRMRIVEAKLTPIIEKKHLSRR